MKRFIELKFFIGKTNYKSNKQSGDSFIKAERGKRINQDKIVTDLCKFAAKLFCGKIILINKVL